MIDSAWRKAQAVPDSDPQGLSFLGHPGSCSRPKQREIVTCRSLPVEQLQEWQNDTVLALAEYLIPYCFMKPSCATRSLDVISLQSSDW
jgi:hypothetical protein